MNPHTRRAGFDVRTFRLQPWKVWALAATGAALAITLAIAMAGLLLILVPVLLIAGLVGRLILGRSARPVRPGPARDASVIEGQYEVIEGPSGRWRR
ncbi:MAG: hypothetical protein AB7I59_01585 [Geminicoccaceae bacterium]